MDKNNIYNDINNSESKQALLESDSPGDYLSKGKTQKENQNNTVAWFACSMALFAMIIGSVAIHRSNHTISNNYQHNEKLYHTSDCLNMKTEIYHTRFCQALGLNYSQDKYQIQDQDQILYHKHMCSELAQGMCEISDMFFKSSLELDPCQNPNDNIDKLYLKSQILNNNNAFSLKASDISIHRNGTRMVGNQQLVDWDKDCESMFKASLDSCFDVCLTSNITLSKESLTLSIRPSEDCCKISNISNISNISKISRQRRDGDWINQMDADIFPIDELSISSTSF